MNNITAFVKRYPVPVAFVAGVVGATLFYVLLPHIAHGTPYCAHCEQKLIHAAQNGDPVAQQKLADAMTTDTPSYFAFLGPVLGFLLFFVITLFIVSKLPYVPIQASQFLNQFRQK